MAFRRGRSSRVARVPDSLRRKKTWTGLGVDSSGVLATLPNQVTLQVPALVAGNTSALALAFVSSAGGFEESTLIRIRGQLTVPKSTVGSAADAGAVFAFGCGFVSFEAASVGAVPNPALAEGASWDGWMFYRSGFADVVDPQGGTFDVKAMRKFDGGQVFCFVAGVATGSGGITTVVSNFAVQSRLLFLLA